MRAGALFFLADPLICDHTKIVIGELEVVLRLNAIAVEVRILRQLAVFLQQLRRIAARPAVNPVELLAAVVRAITAATPTVVIPTIVIQGVRFPNARSVWLWAFRPHDPQSPARIVRSGVLHLPAGALH